MNPEVAASPGPSEGQYNVATRLSEVFNQTSVKWLQSLAAHHPLDALKAAFVQRWAVYNDVGRSLLESSPVVTRLLQKAGEHSKIPDNEIAEAYPALSLKDLEGIFERLIHSDQRKSLGVVYTPDYIIDYLVRTGLDFGWRDRSRPPALYDPSCGSGGFLLRAADILWKDFGIGPEKAFQSSLFGSDKDAVAVENARCLVDLYLLSSGCRALTPCIFEADALVAEAGWIRAATRNERGFDLVTTNPPYVKLQNLELGYRSKLIENYGPYIRGSFSLAPLFLLAGQKALAPEGCLAFVTQNNFFTSLSAVEIRRELQQRQRLRRILDFGHAKIFENASAYTCLLFVGGSPQEEFDYDQVNPVGNPSALQTAHFTRVRHEQLNPDKWRLVAREHSGYVQMLETVGRPLGEVAAIRVGFATLKDSVFQVQDCGDHCVTNAVEGRVYEIERSATRPAAKVADFASADDLRHNRRRVIFPYEWDGKRYIPLPEQTLATLFPDTYRYLCARQVELSSRDNGQKEYPAWYAWGRTQSMEANGPKLLTKTFSKAPQFMWDGSDQLFCNGYAVFQRPAASLFDQIPLAALERILNSRVMHYYATLTSFQIEGGYQCYQKNFIERFGIVEMTEQELAGLLEIPMTEPEEVNAYVSKLYRLPADALNQVLCPS